MLKDNLIEVEGHIKKACEKSGRNPEDVCLVAVSKTKPEEMLMEVYDCGIRQFGENYVQEMVDKVDDLPKDITWHMIGHLQRNKVKYVVGRAAMIHSVDSERLAVAISEEAVKKGLVQDILIEVNVAEEENKFGVTCDEAEEFVKKIAVLPGIRIRGFMTSAQWLEQPVVVDGNVITSRGMGTAIAFALELVRYFTDDATVEHIRQGLVY